MMIMTSKGGRVTKSMTTKWLDTSVWLKTPHHLTMIMKLKTLPLPLLALALRKEKGEVLRKTSKSQNPCTWNTMHWVNLVANGVYNMDNKWGYVSARFSYCTHGTRFQRV